MILDSTKAMLHSFFHSVPPKFLFFISLFLPGVIVSPSNPANIAPEISRQIHLTKPVIAFTTSDTDHKLPSSLKTILLVLPEFNSMMVKKESCCQIPPLQISQSDTAAILHSSGTTGNFKGFKLTHRNFIPVRRRVCGGETNSGADIWWVPYFHVYRVSAVLQGVGAGWDGGGDEEV